MTIEPMTIRKRCSTAIAVTAGLLLAAADSFVSGQPAMPQPSPLVDGVVAGVRLPSTAEDHLALAQEYAAKAADRRKEAEMHRRMLSAYERLAADIAAQATRPQKRGKTVPSGRRAPSKDPVAHYRAHCEGYIRAAEAMADEAGRLAEFHRTRVAELRKAKDP